MRNDKKPTDMCTCYHTRSGHAVKNDVQANKLHAESSKLCAEADKLYAESSKLCAEGRKLCAEASKLYAEGSKLYAKLYVEANKLYAEADKLYAEASKLTAEADKLYVEADKLERGGCTELFLDDYGDEDNCFCEAFRKIRLGYKLVIEKRPRAQLKFWAYVASRTQKELVGKFSSAELAEGAATKLAINMGQLNKALRGDR